MSDTLPAARMRRVLLVGQLAMTVTLLAGAGVFVKSYLAVTRIPLGFDPEHAWSVRMAMAGEHDRRRRAARADTAPGPVTIVGVAANIKEVGLNDVSFADVYLSFAQHPQPSVELIVRGAARRASIQCRR